MSDFTDVQNAAKILSNGNMIIRVVDDVNGVSYPTFLWKCSKKLNSELFDNNNNIFGDESFNVSDNTHPAFIVNNNEVDSFEMSMYDNCIVDGIALSLPFKNPSTGATLSTICSTIKANGVGYHLSTLPEFGYIYLLCRKNGFIPNGNNYQCASWSNPLEIASIASSNADGTPRKNFTGSGFPSWNHNNEIYGISDLSGNVRNWVNGIYMDNTNILVAQNNDFANNSVDIINNLSSLHTINYAATNSSDLYGEYPNSDYSNVDNSVKLRNFEKYLIYTNDIVNYNDLNNIASTDKNALYLFSPNHSLGCDNSISSFTKEILMACGLLEASLTDACLSTNGNYNKSSYRCTNSSGYFNTFQYYGINQSMALKTNMTSFDLTSAKTAKGEHLGFRTSYIDLPQS